MKKLLIVLIVLFTVSAQAVQVYQKGIGGYIEFGQSLEPVDTYYMEDGSKERQMRSDYIAFTDLNLHYVFQAWNLQIIPFTSIKTWAVSDSSVVKGHPFADIYTSGVELLWENISLTIDHYCAHAVYSGKEMWQVKDYRMGQSMTEFKIKYSFN